jgi:F-box-like
LSLPSELLLDIFIQTLPTGPLDEDGRIAFQAIRCVCSSWRALSFGSPRLWSFLSIEMKCSSFQSMFEPALAIRWFQRSGSSTGLELVVRRSEPEEDSAQPIKAALQQLFQLHQSRWSYLWISLNTPSDFWDIFLGVPHGSGWSNLREIRLFSYDLAESDDIDVGLAKRGLIALQSMTSVQRLSMTCVNSIPDGRMPSHPDLPELHLDFEWTALTPSWGKLISAYLNLQKLVLREPNRYNANPVQLEPGYLVTLPRLTSFSIAGTTLALLPHFSTPNLKSLTIGIISDPSRCNPSNLAPFLERCTDALTSVEMYHEQAAARNCITDMTLLLVARPSITKLSLDAWNFTPEYLPEEDVPANWCPNLRQLTVRVASVWSMMEKAGEVQKRQLKALALSLTARNKGGGRRLETLTVRRRFQNSNFPYKLFEQSGVDKICVTVPFY